METLPIKFKWHYLELQNFKEVEYVCIDNFNRMNLIVGGNGIGKSSILTFVSFPFVQNLAGNFPDYIRHGSSFWKGRLVWFHQGFKFDFEIEVKKKSSKKTLILTKLDDNTEKTFDNTSAMTKLAEFYDPIICATAPLVMQSQNTEPLKEGNSDRRKRFKDLFSLGLADKAVDILDLEVKSLKDILTNLESDIRVLTSEKNGIVFHEIESKKDSEDLESKISEYKSIIDDHSIKKEKYWELKSNYDSYKKQLSDLEDLKQEISEYKTSNSQYNKELVKLNSEKSKIQYDPILESNLVKDINTATNFRETIGTKNSELKTNSDSLKRLSRKQDSLLKSIEDFDEKEISKLHAEKEKQTESKFETKNKISNLEKDLKLAKLGKCPECGQDFHSDFKKLEKDLVKTKEILDQIEEDIDFTNGKIEALESLKEVKTEVDKNAISIGNFQEKIKNLTEEITSYDKMLAGILSVHKVKSIEDLESQLENVETLKNEYEEIAEKISDLDSKIQDQEKDISRNEKKIAEISKLKEVKEPKELEELDPEIIEIYDNLKAEYTLIAKHNKDIEYKEEKNKLLRDAFNTIEKNIEAKTTEKVNTETDIAIKLQTKKYLANQYLTHLLSLGLDFINEEMNKSFQASCEKYTVALEPVDTGVEFKFRKPNTEYVTKTALACGFENSYLATCLRTTLCDVYGYPFYVADEIDSEFEDKNACSLYISLYEKQELDCILAITHNEAVKDMLQHNPDVNIFQFNPDTGHLEKIN